MININEYLINKQTKAKEVRKYTEYFVDYTSISIEEFIEKCKNINSHSQCTNFPVDNNIIEQITNKIKSNKDYTDLELRFNHDEHLWLWLESAGNGKVVYVYYDKGKSYMGGRFIKTKCINQFFEYSEPDYFNEDFVNFFIRNYRVILNNTQ